PLLSTRFVPEAAECLTEKVHQLRSLNSCNDSTSNPSPCAISYSCQQCDRLQWI
ncbi:hypothetical protein TNCT_583841, partial [Trichonephila clavata]